jgi:Rps23 Pro-64 3,4-dihydroxylase Tpa1-like proline 4-hydroxylase
MHENEVSKPFEVRHADREVFGGIVPDMNREPVKIAVTTEPATMTLSNFLGKETNRDCFLHVLQRQSEFQEYPIVQELDNGVIQKIDEMEKFTVDLIECEFVSSRIQSQIENVVASACDAFDIDQLDRFYVESRVLGYCNGGFSRLHLDAYKTYRSNRVLSFNYYFFAEPKFFVGGDLRLFARASDDQGKAFAVDRSKPAVTIMPENDMFVIFPVTVPHEVTPVTLLDNSFDKYRFVLTGRISSEA